MAAAAGGGGRPAAHVRAGRRAGELRLAAARRRQLRGAGRARPRAAAAHRVRQAARRGARRGLELARHRPARGGCCRTRPPAVSWRPPPVVGVPGRGTRAAPAPPDPDASPLPQGAGSPASLVSLFFYVATDGQGTLRPHVEDGTRLAAVTGTSEELGDFKITFLRPTTESGEDPKYSRCLAVPAPPVPGAPPGADVSVLAATTTWTRGARGCTASPTWCGAA